MALTVEMHNQDKETTTKVVRNRSRFNVQSTQWQAADLSFLMDEYCHVFMREEEISM